MTVADTLSRAMDASNSSPEIHEDNMKFFVHSILDKLPISDGKLKEMQRETEKDPTLQLLKHYTFNGWTEKKNQIEYHVKPYYPFKKEISYHLGILLKGNNRMIVPLTLWKVILNLIHQGHFGIEKSKQRARSSIYWPGLDNDIAQLVEKWSTCLDSRNNQRRDIRIPHHIPQCAWVKVATDLFELNNRDDLIVIDYHSKFIEVSRLYDAKYVDVIKAMKKIFVTHGIPKQVFSDNGAQYTSKSFKEFSDVGDFTDNTSSPEFPQSNGLVERAVQIVKRILFKAEQTNEDPYLGLLNLNNIPIEDGLTPAEKMFNRRPRTLLPSLNENNHVIGNNHVPEKFQVASRYNHGVIDLSPIQNDTTVRIYSKKGSEKFTPTEII